MKKWVCYALILVTIPVLSFGGFGGEDVGKLSPVQLVMLQRSHENVQLLTDTKEMGTGPDVAKAVINMKQTSAANVFLDTADYLLLARDAEILLPQLQEYLRPSCHVCYVSGDVDLEQAGQFLQLHEPELTMADYEAGERRLPLLISKEGKLKLERP